VRIAKRYKEKLAHVIDRLMGARTTLPDGSVGFNAVEHEFCLSVLESAIDFQPVIPEPDRRGLIRDAVRATGTWLVGSPENPSWLALFDSAIIANDHPKPAASIFPTCSGSCRMRFQSSSDRASART
jgi:hypothetical protein